MTEIAHGARAAPDNEPILPQWWRTVDRWSLACVVVLFGIGILLLLAASPPLAIRQGSNPFYFVYRQAIFGSIAITILLVLSILPQETVRRMGILGAIGAIIAIMLLPLFGTDHGQGAMRWFSLGFMNVQPSEFLKPGLVILTAWIMAATTKNARKTGYTISAALTGLLFIMLALQPDFGQAFLIAFSWVVMYFVSGASLLALMAIFLVLLAAALWAYQNYEHFSDRIDMFLNDRVEPHSQISYALDSIKGGGVFGVGVGEGSLKWSLPDAHTDFIIAVAAEEYGMALVLTMIGLYAVILVRSLYRLSKERDLFIQLASSGLVVVFSLQAMINLAVSARLVPTKGMTLPFISYGGSSLVASAITIGMLLALTRTRPQGAILDLFSGHPGGQRA